MPMTLMFDKKAVEETQPPLARLIRLIFYKRGVTMEDFSAAYADHGRRMGLNPQTTNSNRENARKALNKPDAITFRFVYYTLLNILHLDIEEIHIVVRNKDGQLVTYSNTDPVE